jgi:GntR family transcriptional regulator
MAQMNFQPLYAQVRRALIARLTAGEWTPGAMLPGESTLAAELRVSPGTVRKAVESLVADGVLRRHQGKGTFVTEQTPERANYHFFRLVDSAGERVLPQTGSEVVVIVPAGAETARRLGLGIGETVVLIDRVRAIADRPAILETVEVPAALMPGLERETPLPNALYPHYQARHGISVISTDDRLSAAAADPVAAKTLEVAEGTPLLLVERVAYDLTGRAVEWRRSRFLSDGLAYAVTLG